MLTIIDDEFERSRAFEFGALLALSDRQLGDTQQEQNLAQTVLCAYPRCRYLCPTLEQHLRKQITATLSAVEGQTDSYRLVFDNVCIGQLLYYGLPVKLPITAANGVDFFVELHDDIYFISYCENLLRHVITNVDVINCQFKTEDESPFCSLTINARNVEPPFDFTQYVAHATVMDDRRNRYADAYECATFYVGPLQAHMNNIVAEPAIIIHLDKLPLQCTSEGEKLQLCIELTKNRYQEVRDD